MLLQAEQIVAKLMMNMAAVDRRLAEEQSRQAMVCMMGIQYKQQSYRWTWKAVQMPSHSLEHQIKKLTNFLKSRSGKSCMSIPTKKYMNIRTNIVIMTTLCGPITLTVQPLPRLRVPNLYPVNMGSRNALFLK